MRTTAPPAIRPNLCCFAASTTTALPDDGAARAPEPVPLTARCEAEEGAAAGVVSADGAAADDTSLPEPVSRFKRFVDDVLKLGRQLRIQPQRGRGGAIQNRVGHDAGRLPTKRLRARGHFVEHHAEAEEIGARVEVLAANLLG